MTAGPRIDVADGVAVATDHVDGDGPAVVLLHAGVADRRAWREVAAVLNERGADVHSYDRRGFGETPGSEQAFDHMEDLVAVLNAVSEQPVWLVGNSQGGLIAIDFAMTHPERVAGLVLIAPAVSGAPEEPDEALDPGTREISKQMEEAEDDGDIDLVNRLEVRLWLDGPAGPEGRVSGHLLDLALDMNGIALLSSQPDDAGQGGRDAWSRLEEIDVPATVVWGDLDIPVIIEASRELAARLPRSGDPVVIEGAAHLPGLERPAATASVIAVAMGI